MTTDKEGNAKIMDFGIARTIRGKGLTGKGIIIGTPGSIKKLNEGKVLFRHGRQAEEAERAPRE